MATNGLTTNAPKAGKRGGVELRRFNVNKPPVTLRKHGGRIAVTRRRHAPRALRARPKICLKPHVRCCLLLQSPHSRRRCASGGITGRSSAEVKEKVFDFCSRRPLLRLVRKNGRRICSGRIISTWIWCEVSKSNGVLCRLVPDSPRRQEPYISARTIG